MEHLSTSSNEQLYRILDATTVSIRKGHEVFPRPNKHAQHQVKIDLVFTYVGVDPVKAEAHRAELIEWMLAFPDKQLLAGGPITSYFKVGQAFGSQDAALRFFALGHVLDLWEIVTPYTLGYLGDQAETLAENGMLYVTGWVDPAVLADIRSKMVPSSLPAMWLRP